MLGIVHRHRNRLTIMPLVVGTALVFLTPTPSVAAAPAQVAAASADLALTVSPVHGYVSPAPPHGDTTVRFTVTVINDGPNAAHDVVVTDGWGFSNFSSVQGKPSPAVSCGLSGGIVTCTKAWLSSGATLTINVSLLENHILHNQIAATDSASVTSATFDPNTTNNSATGLYEVG